MSFGDFSLIPADDPPVDEQQQLDAATAGALALSDDITPVDPDPVAPFGRSWAFDWQAGQFVKVGQSPAQTTGFDTLAEWCQMAIYSARYAHPVFSDEFGMDEPDGVIGEFPVGEAIADWQRALVEALLVHDRISSVENIVLDWDPSTGILTIVTMDVITDEEQTLTVSDVAVQAGGQ